MKDIELFNDHFQNFKAYGIPKAQLIIADVPYNLGANAYASNPAWYVDGDNKNGESALAGKQFFDTDKDFRPAEFMHFCSQMLRKDKPIKEEKSEGGGRSKGGAACMILFCPFEQMHYYIELGQRYGLKRYIPLVFRKDFSAQVLKANMKVVGNCEYGLILYRDRLPKFNNDGRMIFNCFDWVRDTDTPKNSCNSDSYLKSNKDMKDSVIIVSGGMDSITLLHEKVEEIALAVTFDYGSNHNKREAECAARHCQQLGIEHIIIPLAFIGQYFKSSLLEGADAVPEGHYEAENMKSTVVPFRNGIMLSVACGLAESRKLSKVLIANHGGDHAIYPDCRAGFVHSMSEAMRHGTYIGVQIDAPYTGIRKSDIARIGKRLGLDYSTTYSCYKGGEKHCGKCGTCVERKEALRDAEIEDTTEYETE